MNVPTQTFVEEVRSVWGKPNKVADAGIGETFRHPNVFGFDHDDQVDNAKRIGILVGKTAEKGSEAFIEAYTAFLNE